MKKKLLLVFLLLATWQYAIWAQGTIKGKVLDDEGMPVISGTVVIDGTSIGTITDFDGNYELTNVPTGEQVLKISYIGFQTIKENVIVQDGQTLTKDFQLKSDAEVLDEVVVVGYGAIREEDATGAVELLNADDLNKGAIVSADQLLNGKSRGVRIVNNGGTPDAEANIRIRGGSSLTANNAPLIVIDDVPLSNVNVAGQANVFQLVNPNDIESFSILKDASATAIYGSRASNGVILITTKKGKSGKPRFNYSANVQIGQLTNTLDVLDAEEFRSFINTLYPEESEFLGVNGTSYDTDWQDEIYRTSVSTDHNFSVNGSYKNLPYRVSVGYAGIEGILETSKLDRYTAAVSLSPTFLDGDLEVELNGKGVFTRKLQADEGGAIGSALGLNPTIPVNDPTGSDFFGGYYQTLDPNQSERITVGPTNAVALLQQRRRNEDANRFLGNAKFTYKMPFLSQLRAVLNVGMDISSSRFEEELDENAIAAWNNNLTGNAKFNGGEVFTEDQDKFDRTLDAYLTYAKSLDGFISRVDAQAGYAYQHFEFEGQQFPTQVTPEGNRVPNMIPGYFNPLNLQSFFGRVNFDVLDRFLFTASVRFDGSSLFAKENRWGSFPALAAAWRVHEESFLENVSWLNTLKLRAGWGITGQQDITAAAGYFPSTAFYSPGDAQVGYIFGDQIFRTQRADPFNPSLTWEKAITTNGGIDFELFNGFVGGSFDIYYRTTEDLLAEVPLSEGAPINEFVDNIGETESRGWEIGGYIAPIRNENLRVEVNGNFARNVIEVTDLGQISRIPIGGTGIGRGTGINIGQYGVGQVGRTFWLYEQIYNDQGEPIENGLVDQNKDGMINEEDRVFINFDPEYIYGFGLAVNYKNWDLTANLRGQIGGKLFNANLLNRGIAAGAVPVNAVGFLSNVMDLWDAENNEWQGFNDFISDEQAQSDYYVQDASFTRFDNITLGYRFNRLWSDNTAIRVYASVNNLAIFTDYDGIDPENFSGIEQSPYARPRVYTFGFNLEF